ncbi:hypothetical protein FA13DRAFT_1074508 [Coprinellus micaceus]|uniref:Uncharacterized protein n=1 Tax=Coprinellus micaceus TaxID=71717 RepID=A0A4Y7TSU3_COPMI|nr:hypothetical protein FA13DRAFT_1074508 [Coprinellus micaceus]
MPTEVAVFEALSASAAPGGLESESGQRVPIEFSIGEFAGILVGSILGAVIVGAIGAYLVLRRRHAHRSIEAWSDNDGVVARDHALMFEPLQLSGEPQSSSSHAIPSTSYEGSYRPTPATLSPVTQMVSSNANQNIQNIDLAPPMYSDSETPIVTSTRRK